MQKTIELLKIFGLTVLEVLLLCGATIAFLVVASVAIYVALNILAWILFAV